MEAPPHSPFWRSPRTLLSSLWRVYSFLEASITNFHKIGSLKQPIIFSQFERPKGRGAMSLPSKALGEDPSLPLSGGSRSPFKCGCIPSVSAFISPSSSPLCLLLACLSPISPCLSPVKTLIIGFRTHLHNPGWFPHLKILSVIVSAKTLSPT